MSLPILIADRADFETFVCKGQAIPFCVVDGNDPSETTVDILIRSDPSNAALPGYDGDMTSTSAPSTWIFVGHANLQPFPLRAGESINIKVTRRTGIYIRGPVGHKVITVTARLNPKC